VKIVCLTPVYNDWASFQKLIEEIALSAERHNWNLVSIVAINDCSSSNYPLPEAGNYNFPVTIVNLNINVGHQRAIAIGLSYVHNAYNDYDGVVVLDSDGEDKPSDVKALLDRSVGHHQETIVFARRTKRSEKYTFKFFYLVYKFIFRLLTNQNISFGNFSYIPKSLIPKVAALPDSWNHYSGSIIRSRLPYDMVPTTRGLRYFGSSKMNFHSLVLHGLSSISIYLDVVTVKLLIVGIFGFIITIVSLAVVIAIKLFTTYSTPGWASNISLTLINIMGIISIILLLLLFHLNQRNRLIVSPNNIYKEFILNIEINPNINVSN
jgi:hypothetical protein